MPALKTIVEYFNKIGCDEIIHTGDIVSMGPYSPECVDYMFDKGITLVNGNHDLNYINNNTTPPALSHVPEAHKVFVFKQLGDKYRNKMRYLPLIVYRKWNGATFAFLHYALSMTELYRKFVYEPINPNPTAEFFDEVFDGVNADTVFFGHKHESVDVVGKKHYIDVGSVGCHEKAVAQGIVLKVAEDGASEYERISVPYDRESVHTALIERQIPYGEQLWNFYFKENLNKKG